MNDRQKVSVVIPAHNASAWIGECLESIFQQTRRPDEIILVDDASADATVAIAERYVSQGLQILRQAKNNGRYRTQNIAMQAANHGLIAKVDADDRLAPRYLERMLLCFEQPEVVFATCDFRIIEAEGALREVDRRFAPLGKASGRVELTRYLQANRCRGTCVVFRRSALERVQWCDERFIYNGDWWLSLKLLTVGDVFYRSEVLADYRVHQVAKNERALWETRDRLLAQQLLPTILPLGWGEREQLLQVFAKYNRRTLWLRIYPAAPADLKPRLLDALRERGGVEEKFFREAAKLRLLGLLTAFIGAGDHVKSVVKRILRLCAS